jgi:hypothetical protein
MAQVGVLVHCLFMVLICMFRAIPHQRNCLRRRSPNLLESFRLEEDVRPPVQGGYTALSLVGLRRPRSPLHRHGRSHLRQTRAAYIR